MAFNWKDVERAAKQFKRWLLYELLDIDDEDFADELETMVKGDLMELLPIAVQVFNEISGHNLSNKEKMQLVFDRLKQWGLENGKEYKDAFLNRATENLYGFWKKTTSEEQ